MFDNLLRAVVKTVEVVDEVVFRPVAEAAEDIVDSVKPDGADR